MLTLPLVFLWKVMIFILVIGVLVFVHEFGHFIVAKWCGVGVLRFSLGFGRPIFKRRVKETTYQISWIPLGGYVRMVGDMPDGITGSQVTDAAVRDEDAPVDPDLDNAPPEVQAVVNDRSRWFIEKGFWPRSAIVVAGPLFNFIFAWFVFSFSTFMFGDYQLEESPIVGGVMKGSPAAEAGMSAKDHIKTINGELIFEWKDLAKKTNASKGKPLVIAYERNGIPKEVTVVPQVQEMQTLKGKKDVYMVGLEPTIRRNPVGFFIAPYIGLKQSVKLVSRTYMVLWGMLNGALSADDLAGPVFIFQAASQQAEKGFESLLDFMALLSISLAVLNLLPIPVLDGGHLLFFIIESVVGPISNRKKEVAQQVGMLMLLCLMVFAIRNDVTRETPPEDGFKWENSENSLDTKSQDSESKE